MKFSNLSRRAAAVAGVSALAAGALVGTSSTAEAFTTVTNQYTCTAPVGSPFPVFLSSNAPNLDVVETSGVAAGSSIIGGLLTVNNTFTIPDAVHTFMAGVGVSHMAFPDFAGKFGSVTVPVVGVEAEFENLVQSEDMATWSVDAPGANNAFTIPKAGSYDVLSPSAFNLVATTPGGDLPVSCEIAEGQSAGTYATLDVFKNESATAAKAAKSKLKKGKKGVIKATVTAENVTPTGKVLLKNKKGKTVDSANLKGGKASLTTNKLVKGKNVYSVVYKGDGFAKGSKSKSVTITGTK